MEQNEINGEELLYVSKDLINHPLGFVIDAGGTTAKIIYRSNKDYRDGKAIHTLQNSERGILHLRSFQMRQLDKVIDFLKENCDVIKDGNDNDNDDDDDDDGGGGGDDDDDVYWMTGVTTQHFKKELESTFRIKTTLFSEMVAFSNFLINADQFNSECFQVDLDALEWAKNISNVFLDTIKMSNALAVRQTKNSNSSTTTTAAAATTTTAAAATTTTATPTTTPTATTTTEAETTTSAYFLDGPALKLLNCDHRCWADEHLKFTGKIEFPCLLAMLGSAGPIGVMEENGTFNIVDFVYGIGKIMSGLSEELTGESNFDEFVKMAERGNLENVDLSSGDVSNRNHKEDDWYKIMPSNVFVFELGKLSSNNFKGKGQYSKDDLAIGILSCLLKFTSKIIFSNAKLHNVKSVLICGSIVKHELIRHHLLRHLYMETIMNSLNGKDLIKVHILKQPGYVCGLGVWWENVVKQKKKNLLHNNY